MTPEAFGLALSLVSALAPWATPWFAVPSLALAPSFRPAERAVDNWRREGALHLDLTTQQSLALLFGRDIGGLSRCVRLNNYWCVKKAGWSGEIAADSEGHVAFGSAEDGASVAAVLLRRYYLDFKLHSARAIVQRWAPAQCGLVATGAPRVRTMFVGGRLMGGRRLLGPEPRGLTTRGLGATLRARFLASHGRGRKAGHAAGLRRSAVPDRTAALAIRTPTIAAGFGAAEPVRPVRLAMAPFPGLAMGPAPLPGIGATLPPLPALACAPESRRIANYAGQIAAGIAAGPDADLALFDADGAPTPAFARTLVNMAAVEIGPLRARQSLVDAAVAALPPRSKAP